MLEDKGYDGRAADLWSMGVILYVLLAGYLPFDEPTMSALFRKIQKADFAYPSHFAPPVRELIDMVRPLAGTCACTPVCRLTREPTHPPRGRRSLSWTRSAAPVSTRSDPTRG